MPELPEVETVMRGLLPVLAGRKIAAITLNRPDLRVPFPENFSEIMTGSFFRTLRRRGKYILMDMNNGQSLVCHLGMSGSFAINPSTSRPHDHVVMVTDRDDRVVYHDPRRFGMMFFVQTGSETGHPAFASMGAEPLSDDVHAVYLLDRFKGKKTSVKTALLDQSVIAGLGNIYVCEALYEAGISPVRAACDINGKEADRLVLAIRAVLTAAIDSGGSTLRDHRQADGTTGYFQHNFKVYGRVGQKCPVTGGIIQRIVQSGRSTFYCPEKQKEFF